MTLQLEINKQIKQAMIAKDQSRVDVLRQVKTAITNAALASGNASNTLTDNEVIGIIRKQIKQREDSSEQFFKGNRLELVEKEQLEINILKQYLPSELSQEEFDNLIQLAIAETNAITKKDMGKAIKRAVELAEGRIDNKSISQEIAKYLK